MIHSGTKCKQILCKLLSVLMFKRGASSLIYLPVSHRKLSGFVWKLLLHCKTFPSAKSMHHFCFKVSWNNNKNDTVVSKC